MEEKEGVAIIFSNSRYFESYSKVNYENLLKDCRNRGWCILNEPLRVDQALQTILDKNKPPLCKVLGISAQSDRITKVFVKCSEEVQPTTMYDWIEKSIDEVREKSTYILGEGTALIARKFLWW